MKSIQVRLEGVSPLLCHKFTDAAGLSSGSKVNKATAVTDLTPREQAEQFLYTDAAKGKKPIWPAANLYSAIIDAGKFHKLGKKQVTTSKDSIMPGGVWLEGTEYLIAPGKWEVDSRPVVNQAKQARFLCHRPRFDEWALEFDITYDEDMFPERMVRSFVDDAGSKIGIGAFRPARKGPFGRFRVECWTSTNGAK